MVVTQGLIGSGDLYSLPFASYVQCQHKMFVTVLIYFIYFNLGKYGMVKPEKKLAAHTNSFNNLFERYAVTLFVFARQDCVVSL